MLKITELLTPTPGPLWRLVRQAGVEEVVSLLDGGEQMWRWPKGAGSQEWVPEPYVVPPAGERPWEAPGAAAAAGGLPRVRAHAVRDRRLPAAGRRPARRTAP